MAKPSISGPAASSRSPRATWIVVGVVAILAVVVVTFAVVSGAGGPAATSTARSSITASGSAGPTPVGAATSPDEQAPVDTAVPEPTLDLGALKPCASDGLAMAAGGWGGATGSMGGGATLINMSNEPCRLAGRPGLELLDQAGKVIASGDPAAAGEAIGVYPGGAAGVIAVWGNWCGDPPAEPLSMRLSLLEGAGTLSAEVRNWEPGVTHVPRCDAAGEPSTIGAPVPFSAVGPGEAVPASLGCVAGDLDAFLGSWGAAAGTSYAPVVLLNRSDVTCSVPTDPALELRDGDGKLLETRGLPSGSATLDLAPSATAITYVGFADWCIAPPKLPFRFDLQIGGETLTIVPTSSGSEIGLPFCNSISQTPPPTLFLSDPFALPRS